MKRDITTTLGGNVGATILSLGNAIILARVLGPANRGLLGLALLIPTIAGTFCIVGQDMVNATFGGLYKDKRSSLFQQSLVIALFGSVVSTLVICAFYFWLPISKGRFGELGPEIIWLTCLVPPVLLLSRMLIALVRGVGRISTAAVIHVAQTAVFLCLLSIFLAWWGCGLKAAVVLTALSSLVAVAFSIYALWDYATLRPSVFSGWLFKKSLAFGGQISLATFASFLLYRIDQGILAFMVPVEQVGLYVVAVALAERLRLLPNSIAQAFLPRLSNEITDRQAQVPMVFRCSTIVSAGSMLMVAILGAPVIVLLFGWDYSGSILSFLLLLPGLAALGGAAVLSSDLAAREKPKYSVWIGYIMLVVNIVLNLALIPLMGIAGAALASSISYIGSGVLWLIFYRRESQMPIRQMIPCGGDFVYLYRTGIELFKQLWQLISRRGRI
ncbi:MAG: oligosaccharide flippase family protein [Planctomycetota bacterium]